ncbi:MAG TPA: DUF2179 domain-containing protein [Halanaerobiales bacterium]|nr:DUF2179 domain-containing protein [Halanaerobiales bacterium]
MSFQELYASPQFAFIVLPLIIFICRIVDVTLGTLRVIFISKGYRAGAAILGFFEVLIWITVIGEVMNNASNVYCYLGYAAGFATGNYVGIWVGGKLSLGFVVVRIITREDSSELISHFREQNYGVTVSEAVGASGKVKIIFTIVKRKNLKKIINNINLFNPGAFYSVEDVRSVKKGVFPEKGTGFKSGVFSSSRKGK